MLGFDAFISYARKPSTQLAIDLQNGLEKFAKPWNRLRAIRVFRDDSSMSANSALWSTIESALREAKALILLVTPESAVSPYVNNEVNWWVRNKGIEHLLLVHAGGTISWDSASGDFTGESTVPATLRGHYREEPRWIDLTWFSNPGSLRSADPQFLERVADLAAVVRDVPRDMLIGENVRQHRKTVRLTRAAIAGLSVLLVLALVAGGVAFVQRREAIHQRDTATEQSLVARVGRLAAMASSRAPVDLQSALLLAASAYGSRANPTSVRALHDVITTTPQLVQFVDFQDPVTAADATATGSTVVGATVSGRVVRVDLSTGARDEIMDFTSSVDFLAISADGLTIAASAGSRSRVWSNGVVQDQPETKLIAMSPSGRTTVAQPDLPIGADPYLEVRSGDRRTPVRTALADSGENRWISLPDDQTIVAVTMSGNFIRASALTGEIQEQGQGLVAAWNLGLGAISGDGNRFGYISDKSNTVAWDLARPPATLEDPVSMTSITGVRSYAIALNHNGTQMAVAGDGAIHVADLQPHGTAGAAVTLRGAGMQPDNVRFASDTMLLSVSGSTVALWDLTRTVPLATIYPIEVGKTCNACGPPSITVTPAGQKVVVVSSSTSTLTNLTTGHTATYPTSQRSDATLNSVLGAQPVVAALDDDRIFIYAPRTSKGLILGGENMDRIEQIFDLPRIGTATESHAALRADGKVIVIAGNMLVRIDPQTGTFDTGTTKASAISADGAFALHISPSQDFSTANIEITDTSSKQTFAPISVKGQLVDFIGHGRAGITLLRTLNSDTWSTRDTEVLRVNPRDGSVRAVGQLGQHIVMGSQVTAIADTIYAEKSGMVTRYNLADAEKLDIVPVVSAVKAWNGLGLTADGRSLIVASEPTQTVMRLPVAAEEWSAIACREAGRHTSPADLDAVVSPLDGLHAGCA
ncbi:TIR domain-containing protein [Mycobacteroides saopaulense]|uniref:TIR domain-containing protein n=1 Tax=Mycobacteroides saopaulense TaxID=1578165 RepID=A0ABX3C432_9MYCO|nr:TIR domain-containing protein [Mycobacteroides saopaulense]OHT88444.1 hypothetical protein BKG68_00525 [Mycobacteroides saopaulense]OHU13260.1 hypothetical protein BKG73_00530 [Mycobacteroides saopaulense]